MAASGVLTLSDATIGDCDHAAISGDRVRAARVVVEGNRASGIRARSLQATDVVVQDNAATGILADAVDARGLVVRDNGDGVEAVELRGTGVEASGNDGDGLRASSLASLREVEVTDNGGLGIAAGPYLRLFAATVTGNRGGADIASERKPLLRRSTCGRSIKSGEPGTSFGVCAGDP